MISQIQCDALGVESQAFSNPQTITAAVKPSDPIVIMDHLYSTAEVDDQSPTICTKFERCVLYDSDNESQ